jgi:hypothetical protein
MVYRLPSGKYKLSGRNVTDAVDEDANTLLRKMGVKSFKELYNDNPNQIEKIEQGKLGGSFIPIPPHQAVKYWGIVAVEGNKKAMKLLQSLRENPQILGLEVNDIPVFLGNRKPKPLTTEKSIQNKLKDQLGGETEVLTTDGRIDLLTSLEIIEIKHVKAWKSAIGQVLIYGNSYPSHSKRIHLFGCTHGAMKDRIAFHCEKLGITVSWEYTTLPGAYTKPTKTLPNNLLECYN